MCKVFPVIALLTLFFAPPVHALPDEESLARLDSMLVNYVSALEPESVEVKMDEADFLISTSSDSLVRDRIAKRLFSLYRDSRIMGDEAVGVHIYDKWYVPGKVSFGSAEEESEARMFVEFNRSTLIGCKAPCLELCGELGEPLTLPVTGGKNLLFFYDTDCSKCKLEILLLKTFLDEIRPDLTLCAIYVGSDRDAWESFRKSQADISGVKVVHAWDPDHISSFEYLYGVISTPKMFLLDSYGVVAGRRLDTSSLKLLLDAEKIRDELESRAPLGSRIAAMKLPGRKLSGGTSREGIWNIRRFGRVVFYTEGCSHCSEALAEAERASDGVKTLLVNLDEIFASDRKLAVKLFDTFDLTALPYVIELRRGIIAEKHN